MRTVFFMLIISVLLINNGVSAPFAKWTKTTLTLNNGVVQRVIQLPSDRGQFLTTSYKPVTGEFKYFNGCSFFIIRIYPFNKLI